MDSPIICPNCGAPNESTSSSCQFCGAPLAVPTKTKTNRKKKTKSRDSSSNVSINKVKGKPQIKYDERIFRLEYDEIEDDAKLCLSYDIISLGTRSSDLDYFAYDFTLDKLYLDVETIVSDGIKYHFDFDSNIDKKNIDLLETFCNLNLKNCRIDEFDQEEKVLFVLICRAFYNTIFDHSKYTDAADKLYEYYLQSDAYKRKIEKEKAEKEEKRRKIEQEEEQRREEERDRKYNEIEGKIGRFFNILYNSYVVILILSVILLLIFPDSEWSICIVSWVGAPFIWFFDWIGDVIKGIFPFL